MGPLSSVRVLEMAGIGPAPFAGMMLADMGADVIRIDRLSGSAAGFDIDMSKDVSARGRRSVAVDLKQREGVETVLSLCEQADILIEGFRPGVMERLGLGPAECLLRNQSLIYGRITGWGQEGPLAKTAGHDINYIALAGALHAIGRKGDAPVAPLNLLGDYGGGGMLLAFGVLAALIEARQTGKGQVVDAAMLDGAALLMSVFYGLKAMGQWQDERGVNLIDTGGFFYETYQTRDGKYLSVGPIEPKFFEEFLRLMDLEPDQFGFQNDPQKWPDLKTALQKIFLTKTRDEWMELFTGSDACVAPVLSMDEAPRHTHNRSRKTFVEAFGIVQPAPAPRFSTSPGTIKPPPACVGQHTRAALAEWGTPDERINALLENGIILQADPSPRAQQGGKTQS